MQSNASEHASSPESPTTPEPSATVSNTASSKKGGKTKGSSGNSKRVKTTRACDECRKRKVKCDGVQPCSKCRKSEIPCVFAKLPPKRGPPKQYIELLEARLQLIEKALRSIDGPARRVLDDVLSQQEGSRRGSIDEIKEEEHNEVSTAAPCSPKQSSNDDDRFGINEIGQALYVNDIRARIDRLPSIHNDSRTMSLGRQTPPPHRYSDSQSDVDLSSMMDTDTSEHATAATSTNASSTSAPLSSTSGLPSDVPSSLLKTFFAHVHKYAPMIHKPYFYKQLASKSDPPSPLLLYAMCAVASRWTGESSAPSSAAVGPGASASNGGGAATAVPPGFSYYQRAFALIDEYSDAPRVSTIQALVLLTKYQEYYRRLGFFCRPGLYLSMAVRMCNDLGLPKLEASKFADEDPQELETKKRTFWMAFMYDLMMSIEQGREPFFGNIACTTEYPLATNEEGPVLEELITSHNIVIQLGKILSDIFMFSRRIAARQHAQGDNRSRHQIVEEHGRLFLLHTHLENFIHELPSLLQYAPTQDSRSYPADKQPISDVFVGFLHMTYHFSIILLHRHYVLHPLPPDSQFEMEPYPHRTLCATSASHITHIAETIMGSHARDVFSYPTRGAQHTIHCVTLAATVHRDEITTSQDKAVAEVAKQQYAKALAVLTPLASESPAVEFQAHVKEAELSHLYGRMAVDPSAAGRSSHPASYSPAHSSAASVGSVSTDGVPTSMAPAAATPVSTGGAGSMNDRVSLSDASSTSSSPVLSSSVDMPRPPRSMKLPKNRRHTLTGPSNGGPQLMHMAKQVPGQRQTPPTGSISSSHASPFNVDAYSHHHPSALMHSSATFTNPARFASMMMQSGCNVPMYNHHQQPLPHPQQQQQQPPHPQQQQQQLMNPQAYLQRKSRLNHHWSYSQEDLRSLRRAHMNKPIGGGNWPPSSSHQQRAASVAGMDYGYPNFNSSASDMYPNYGPPATNNRMAHQLRRQSSMTAMMPSYYAQRQQQQQLMQATPPPPPPLPRQSSLPNQHQHQHQPQHHHQQQQQQQQTQPVASAAQQPPAPSPQPSVPPPSMSLMTHDAIMDQTSQSPSHHRRHTISGPGSFDTSGSMAAVPTPEQAMLQPQQHQSQQQVVFPTGYADLPSSVCESMHVDTKFDEFTLDQYQTTPDDTQMMLDPSESNAGMLNQLLLDTTGEMAWPNNGSFEDFRSEGHVM